MMCARYGVNVVHVRVDFTRACKDTVALAAVTAQGKLRGVFAITTVAQKFFGVVLKSHMGEKVDGTGKFDVTFMAAEVIRIPVMVCKVDVVLEDLVAMLTARVVFLSVVFSRILGSKDPLAEMALEAPLRFGSCHGCVVICSWLGENTERRMA
jgi:hypothetical protein